MMVANPGLIIYIARSFANVIATIQDIYFSSETNGILEVRVPHITHPF